MRQLVSLLSVDEDDPQSLFYLFLVVLLQDMAYLFETARTDPGEDVEGGGCFGCILSFCLVSHVREHICIHVIYAVVYSFRQ